MSTPTSKRKIFFSISAILIVIGIVFLFVNGLNLGIDFKGGTTYQFKLTDTKYSAQVEKDIQSIVKQTTDSKNCVVQQIGSDEVSIRTDKLSNAKSDALKEALIAKYKFDAKSLRFETVSGTVSSRLILDSLKAIGLAVILMLIYIWFRFDLKSGASAVLALVHDVLIMLGFYAIFGFAINTSFIAAILTIVGYSINDTIVTFDRIREIGRKVRKTPFTAIANMGVNETVTRSIFTSVTTLLTIVVLYVIGVTSIKEFALPIIVGIIVGTYSSIFIASPLWTMFKKDKVQTSNNNK